MNVVIELLLPTCLMPIFLFISFKQAHSFNPMTRMLLEHIHKIIIDDGNNPKQLWGKNIAQIMETSVLELQIILLK